MQLGKGAQVQMDNYAFSRHQFRVTTRDPERENDIFNRKTHAVYKLMALAPTPLLSFQ